MLQLDHQQTLARFAGMPQPRIDIMLVDVQQPENIGQILRVADAVAARHAPHVFCLEVSGRSRSVFAVADLPMTLLLIAGGERHGVPEALLQQDYQHVHVPMYGHTSSLNVATAVAVAAQVLGQQQLCTLHDEVPA